VSNYERLTNLNPNSEISCYHNSKLFFLRGDGKTTASAKTHIINSTAKYQIHTTTVPEYSYI